MWAYEPCVSHLLPEVMRTSFTVTHPLGHAVKSFHTKDMRWRTKVAGHKNRRAFCSFSLFFLERYFWPGIKPFRNGFGEEACATTSGMIALGMLPIAQTNVTKRKDPLLNIYL